MDKEQTPLRKAVEWLKKQKRIRRDKDLQEMFSLQKSTISGYLSGKASPEFEDKFEEMFDISLKDFENHPKIVNEEHIPMEIHKQGSFKNTTSVKGAKDVDLEVSLADACIANKEASIANRILAEGQRELIQILKASFGPMKDEILETQIEDHSRISALEEMVIDLQVKVGLVKSHAEGADKIHKALDADLQERKADRNHGAADKLNKNEAFL